jgi:hypothetical protein
MMAISALVVFSIACTQSPTGSVTELLETKQPTFNGKATENFTTPTTSITLNGECDTFSYALQWSTDQSNWTEISGGCPAGTFTITVSLLTRVTVYVRAKTKTGYTASGIANVRLLLPPTSPYIKMVNSGRANDEHMHGSQNEMSNTSAATLSNGAVVLKSTMTDIIYEN